VTDHFAEQLVPHEVRAQYVAEITALALYGMEQYASHDGMIEPVYQISIWTDVEAAFSAINFETKEHAQESVNQSVQWWLERGNVEEAQRSSSEPYNGNPQDFKYKRFTEASHPALVAAIGSIELMETIQRALETELAVRLLEVVEKLIVSPEFEKLPKEPTVYIGVSSPDDWYDHIRVWTAD